MIEEHFVCGACVEEDGMAIVDAIAERIKSLVPKYIHNAIDDAVADEQNKHMMKKKVLITTNSVRCSTKIK
eukprot:4740893-Ditylum_brightwellii.AAC.1